MSESEFLTEQDRKILGQLHKGTRDPRDWDGPDLAEAAPILGDVRGESHAITKEVCNAIRSIADDYQYATIADYLGVHENTIKYHVWDNCDHGHTLVDERRCNVIRCAAHDGVRFEDLVSWYSFVTSRHQARRHAVGQCDCDAEVAPAPNDWRERMNGSDSV